MPARRPRVLVADDYSRLITAVSRLLDGSCDVIGRAADATELLAGAANLRPDVVVVDVHLEGMDGIEACRRIRESLPHTAVVVISAETDVELEDLALEAGASAFVQKFRIADDLESAVQKAFAARADADHRPS